MQDDIEEVKSAESKGVRGNFSVDDSFSAHSEYKGVRFAETYGLHPNNSARTPSLIAFPGESDNESVAATLGTAASRSPTSSEIMHVYTFGDLDDMQNMDKSPLSGIRTSKNLKKRGKDRDPLNRKERQLRMESTFGHKRMKQDSGYLSSQKDEDSDPDEVVRSIRKSMHDMTEPLVSTNYAEHPSEATGEARETLEMLKALAEPTDVPFEPKKSAFLSIQDTEQERKRPPVRDVSVKTLREDPLIEKLRGDSETSGSINDFLDQLRAKVNGVQEK